MKCLPADFSSPSTRYQGSKRKILPWIFQKLNPLLFETAVDVFGGSGSVSYLLKRMGKNVTYNDALRWNYLNAIALVENGSFRLSEDELETLLRPVTRKDTNFVSRTFKGMYYIDSENLWIDAIVNRIKEIRGDQSSRKYKIAIAYYALFQSCLAKRPFNLFHRRNLSIRTANVERTFGNKTTWDTPFPVHFRRFVKEIHSHTFEGVHKCRASNYDAHELNSDGYDLAYFDPPYVRSGKRIETSNYHKCYHFLEGLANYPRWHRMIDSQNPLRSLRSDGDDAWLNPIKVSAAIERLFVTFRKSIIVTSYKKHGIPSIEALVKMLKRLGMTVSVHSRHYKYALNHQNGSAAANRECLIVASPK
jgi:adenine-specific DNA-methyltransferase